MAEVKIICNHIKYIQRQYFQINSWDNLSMSQHENHSLGLGLTPTSSLHCIYEAHRNINTRPIDSIGDILKHSLCLGLWK